MGYLICDKCGGYYELQEGESPDDFTGKCDCGGKLKYVERIDNAVGEQESKDRIICPKCGFEDDKSSKFCSKCGIRLKPIGSYNRKSKRKKHGKGMIALLVIAIFLIGCVTIGPIVLTAAGYYFMVYEPYHDELSDAKQMKIDEVNTYFNGSLATAPEKTMLLSEIDAADVPEEVLAVDVLSLATKSWRQYQNQQINTNKDPSGKVMITYTTGSQKDVIMKVADAQKLVSQADANVLSNMKITSP